MQRQSFPAFPAFTTAATRLSVTSREFQQSAKDLDLNLSPKKYIGNRNEEVLFEEAELLTTRLNSVEDMHFEVDYVEVMTDPPSHLRTDPVFWVVLKNDTLDEINRIYAIRRLKLAKPNGIKMFGKQQAGYYGLLDMVVDDQSSAVERLASMRPPPTNISVDRRGHLLVQLLCYRTEFEFEELDENAKTEARLVLAEAKLKVESLGLGQVELGALVHDGLYAGHGYDEDRYGMFIKKIYRRQDEVAAASTTDRRQDEVAAATTTAGIRATLLRLFDAEGSRKRQISANTEATVIQPSKPSFRRTNNRVLSSPAASEPPARTVTPGPGAAEPLFAPARAATPGPGPGPGAAEPLFLPPSLPSSPLVKNEPEEDRVIKEEIVGEVERRLVLQRRMQWAAVDVANSRREVARAQDHLRRLQNDLVDDEEYLEYLEERLRLDEL